jgi:predicted amidohydrolase YtcJ
MCANCSINCSSKPDPPGGKIHRYHNGIPSGLLEEAAQFDIVWPSLTLSHGHVNESSIPSTLMCANCSINCSHLLLHRALQELGADSKPDPPGGKIHRYHNGIPSGLLEEATLMCANCSINCSHLLLHRGDPVQKWPDDVELRCLDPRPIYIEALDLHSTWCNNAALQELGADSKPDPL